MSLSSLLRVANISLGAAEYAPRTFGMSSLAATASRSRLIRGLEVGLDLPKSLPAPTRVSMDLVDVLPDDIVEPVAPAPDLAEVHEAARVHGYNEGFDEGLAAGMAAAEKNMAAAVEQLSRLASSILENHSGFYRAAERQVVDLSLQIAQKVVEHEVENIPDLAVGVIRSALEEMDARTVVRVRVSLDDEELLRRQWASVVPLGINPERIEIQSDPRIQAGGAIIETTQGQVDAQLETKLAQLGSALWAFTADVDSAGAQDDEGLDYAAA
jgi:flagellar assembly protein FliH